MRYDNKLTEGYGFKLGKIEVQNLPGRDRRVFACDTGVLGKTDSDKGWEKTDGGEGWEKTSGEESTKIFVTIYLQINYTSVSVFLRYSLNPLSYFRQVKLSYLSPRNNQVLQWETLHLS